MELQEKVNVLLVDDQPQNLLALEASLDSLGLRLVKAGSGAEALRACLQQDFAAILLDVQMPGMDGFETASLMRQRGRSQLTPIIFLTAFGKSEDHVFRGYSLGAVDYIFKPFVPEVLRAKVTAFVDLFQTKEALKQQATELERGNQTLSEQLREIERLNAELEAAYKELESFSYSVSHDLRSPLNAIFNFSQLLQEDSSGLLDESGQDHLQRVISAASRMDQLIEDLLALSKVARVPVHRSKVDLTRMADEIVGDLAAKDPHRQVQADISTGMTVEGDENLLRIVLENLLGNAWKYTGKQRHPQVSMGRVAREGRESFYVRDNGVGFDMAQAQRLFTPFQRLPTANDFQGTGIGLATVQRIIRRHGGQIWAEAEVGKGAAFYFSI